jgi:hypothetical protein
MMRLWEQFIFLDTSLPKRIFVNRAPRGSKYLFRRRSSFFVLVTPNSGVSFLRETFTDNEEAPSSRCGPIAWFPASLYQDILHVHLDKRKWPLSFPGLMSRIKGFPPLPAVGVSIPPQGCVGIV